MTTKCNFDNFCSSVKICQNIAFEIFSCFNLFKKYIQLLLKILVILWTWECWNFCQDQKYMKTGFKLINLRSDFLWRFSLTKTGKNSPFDIFVKFIKIKMAYIHTCCNFEKKNTFNLFTSCSCWKLFLKYLLSFVIRLLIRLLHRINNILVFITVGYPEPRKN